MSEQKNLQTHSKELKVVFLIFLVTCTSVFPTDQKYSLDYIYVNANTGQSSGGHSAIRLGDLVYHFQYFPDKIFHIVREPWENFQYIYGIQENRTIFIRKIKLSKDNFDFFLSRMNEIYLIQKKELDTLSKLDNDVKILESVLYGDQTLHLKAAGYFSENNSQNDDFVRLEKKIISEFGSNFIIKNLNQTRKILNSYEFVNFDLPEPIDKSVYPRNIDTFSTQYLEKLSLLKVYSVLYEKNSLNPESVIQSSSGDLVIDNAVLIKLSAYLESIEDEIISLLKSNSNNKGYPLLVSIARYLVIQKTIQEKKIFLLDSFGKNQTLVIGEIIKNKPYLEKINKQLTLKVKNAFIEFQSNLDYKQRNYNVLEDIVSRKKEILEALKQSKPIRVNYEINLPSKEEDVRIEFNQSSFSELKKVLNRAISNRVKYELYLQKKYPFNLFEKNCTTEIFHSINSFFENGNSESSQKLGGVVKGNDIGVFIPVYAYYAVKKNYNVFAEISVPSLRSRILSQNSEKGVLFSINESSTITSKFYKFNQEDSIFIFFTDDVLWQRPFYGIVNLVVGIGELGYGIIISPFDKGNTIVKGLQGVFFSGPEIIFFNIRKGTFLYELDGQWKDSNDDNFNN
ncbi:MAG: hypothetical protein IPL26_01480 [Leptospiraceae bacterium]|nr:hypothetical protein [Leptospiraceae bacterium]